jgi:uncharacterized protein YjiS (DUF1127 family)
MKIVERYRRFVRYREMVRELHAYSDGELNDLGVARADIEQIAFEAVRNGHGS